MRFLSRFLVVVLLVAGFASGYVLGLFTSTSTVDTGVGGGAGTSISFITIGETITIFKPTTITLLSEKTVTDAVTVTITRTFSKTTGNNGTGCIVFKTDREVYKISEKIFLVLVNNCDYVLVLSNSAPWMIVDEDGGIVFSPIALQVITEVKPGGERRWAWDQRDNDGNQVPARTYYARLFTINAGVLKTEFKIIEPR